MRLPLVAALLAPLPAWAEPPAVVTDIAPVHSLVSQVMAGVAEPTLLLDGVADPHSVSLRPSQARALENADLVIWVGDALTPWLGRALADLSGAETIALLDHPATTLRDFVQVAPEPHEANEDDHLDTHAHDDDHDDDHDDPHAHGDDGVDPHAWLSPDNARGWLGALAEALAARDPENAERYTANAEAAIVDLTRLDARIEAQLEPFAGTEIVTLHDAFGYFADTYRLEVAGSVKAGDGAAPSAAAVDALQDIVAEHAVSCAFSEPGADTGLLDTIAGETGLRIGVLDMTGVTLTPGPELYGRMMADLADSVETCLTAD
ncbi:MAG: zinc ABC transporter substrate-binding protein [Maritimibacter harenae]|uniref:High-affinity zinc uptake system protein ZnuA n=1 Tax=Maritimibacter harenae TaxID=2606218 RepID=A0A845M4K7_9RHOB|nr:zinc ABC transporter substrate-binding protein [Maritimibacter harenae]MZR12637.1 zinc ABC transporter solute-binding protein [Maritimibacter harenae]